MANSIRHIPIYAYVDLSDTAKERVRQDYRETGIAADYCWHDETESTIKEVCGHLGMDDAELSFSGFWSRSDGASIIGHWYGEHACAQVIEREWPQDETLQEIARDLDRLSREHSFGLSASLERDYSAGNYVHENTVWVRVHSTQTSMSTELDKEVTDIFRRLMCWSYRFLESEYDHLVSDESIDNVLSADSTQDYFANGALADSALVVTATDEEG